MVWLGSTNEEKKKLTVKLNHGLEVNGKKNVQSINICGDDSTKREKIRTK